MGGEKPTNASLDALFAGARSGRVVTVHDGEVLAEVERGELGAVRAMLRIVESEDVFHCMCRGDLAIELRGRLLSAGSVSYHHGRSLRVEGWRSDAMLAEGPALLRWLASRGVTAPLAEYDAAEAQARRAASAFERWREAVPEVLRAHVAALDGAGLPSANPAPFQAALAALRGAHGDDEQVARVLIAWLAEGAGPWSGYASYEGTPMRLLDLLDGAAVVRAAADPALTAAQTAAAARFLGGHEVVSFRKSLLATVPDELFARARPHVAASGVEDDLVRFDHAVRIARGARARFANPAPYPIGGDCTVVGESADGPLSGVATDGGRLWSVDVRTIVQFEPGSIAPATVAVAPEHFVVIAASAQRLAWLCINAGTVDAIDRAQPAEPAPIARLGTRLLEIAVAGRTVVWLGDAPARSLGLGNRWIWARSPDDPEPRQLAELGADAWCLQADATHAYILGGAFTSEGVLRRVSLARGTIDEVGSVPKLGPSMGSPMICPHGDDVLVAHGERVLAYPKSGGAGRVALEASQLVRAIAADEHGIVVLSGPAKNDDRWRIESAPAVGAQLRRAGEFDRRPYHRHPLVVTRTAAIFPCGDRLLAAPR